MDSLKTGQAVALAAIVAILLMTWPERGFAQTDEIQVYDAEIADPGVLNLEVHNDYTFEGLKTPRFPGGLVPNTRSMVYPNGLTA